MSRVVTEYKGIKYSLQPHGLKSRALVAFAFFVVAFGGALLVATPAQADNEPPGTCYVAVVVSSPSPQPSVSPSTTPSPLASCPTTPAPVTTTITVPGPAVTVVKTETKTVYITETVTQTAAPTSAAPAASTSSVPSRTPSPPMLPTANSEGSGSNLVGWGLGLVGVGGLALTAIGAVGIVRRRRHQGAHRAGDQEEHDVSDYDPDQYDSNLGGHAGDSYVGSGPSSDETAVIPTVRPEGLDETKTFPTVEK